MNRTRPVILLAFSIALVGLATWRKDRSLHAQQDSGIDQSSYVVERNVMVPMRDGVRLATNLCFPARKGVRLEGKFPAIMERTPYNKDGASAGWGAYYASNGYVAIVQDTRGRYDSEGIWHMMTDDAPDGFDTATWIVKRPWSDGSFATRGTSYPGAPSTLWR